MLKITLLPQTFFEKSEIRDFQPILREICGKIELFEQLLLTSCVGNLQLSVPAGAATFLTHDAADDCRLLLGLIAVDAWDACGLLLVEDGVARADAVRSGVIRLQAEDVPVLRRRKLHPHDNDGP